MGRMQKGEYDSPLRIRGIIVGANRIRPYIAFAPILYSPNIMHLSQKIMAKFMVYRKMFHTRV